MYCLTYSRDNAMNKNVWNDFWAAMPPEMKLILGVVVGGIVRYLKNRALPIAEGVSSLVIASVAGYITTFGVCYVIDKDYGELWFMGSGIAFLINHILNGADNLGKQFADKPIKVIISVLSEVVDLAVEKYEKYSKYFKKP